MVNFTNLKKGSSPLKSPFKKAEPKGKVRNLGSDIYD